MRQHRSNLIIPLLNPCHQQAQNKTVTYISTSKTSLKLKQGNRKYRTSPVLCKPTTPFVANRIACTQKFSEYYLRLPGMPNDPFCCMMSLAIE